MAKEKIEGKKLNYDSGSDTIRDGIYYLKNDASSDDVKKLFEKARKERKVRFETKAQQKLQIRYNGSDHDDYTLEKAA